MAVGNEHADASAFQPACQSVCRSRIVLDYSDRLYVVRIDAASDAAYMIQHTPCRNPTLQ